MHGTVKAITLILGPPHANSSQFTLTQREGLPTWHKEDRQPACSGEVKGFRLGTGNKSEGACQDSG